MILFGLFITQYKGRKEGDTGKMELCPSQRDMGECASSLPFPDHQRSHCYQLYFDLDGRHLISV